MNSGKNISPNGLRLFGTRLVMKKATTLTGDMFVFTVEKKQQHESGI